MCAVLGCWLSRPIQDLNHIFITLFQSKAYVVVAEDADRVSSIILFLIISVENKWFSEVLI